LNYNPAILRNFLWDNLCPKMAGLPVLLLRLLFPVPVFFA
jgi:hypothetical protein